MEDPTLVIVHEKGAQLRVPITGALVLGRDPANEVTIDDGYLSRRHCQVSHRDSRVIVRDLESYNGTYVNGQRIHEECYLLPGDVLKVGRTRLFVDFGDVANQSGNLKIYSPNLQPRQGVQPVTSTRSPEVISAFKNAVQPPPPAGSVPSTCSRG